MDEEQNRITPEIIQKCVAKEFSTEEKNVQILDLEVSPGAAHGDNFATVVKLAKFKYKLMRKKIHIRISTKRFLTMNFVKSLLEV